MSKLKPCPFCGSGASLKKAHDYDGCLWVSVMCRGCGVETQGKWVSDSSDACPVFYAEVCEEWDRRTPPDGMALVPREITAETGHKAGMMGDFKESVEVMCSECAADDPDPECGECGGLFFYQQEVAVSWPTIKAIHKRAVELSETDAP